MPAYRVTMLIQFNGQPPCGFSERWDVESATRDTAKIVAQNLANARAKFLSGSWTILIVRIGELSVVETLGKKRIKQTVINLCPEISSQAGLLPASDIPNGAVYVKCLFQSGFKPRSQQFRGVPDIWWTEAASSFSVIRPYITRYSNALRLNQFGRAAITSGESPTVAVVKLDCMDVRRVSSRRTGRPFGLLRGRKPKKKMTA